MSPEARPRLTIDIQKTPQPRAMPASSDLQFGRHFSDHWFAARYQEGRGWYDARVMPYSKIEMDPAASVLHYGQALFEGMKAFRSADGDIRLFRPEFNFERMRQGAERLCMEPPTAEIFFGGLKAVIETDANWVPSDEGCSLYIRPTLIGTEGFLGVRPSRELLFFILLSPVGSYYSKGTKPTRIWVEDHAVRAAKGGLGDTKAGANYAASLQSALKAKQKGYDQVLWLDVEHQGIEEVGTMNIFLVFDNEIVTPALNGSILAGGTRQSVIDFLAAEGKHVVERRVTMSEVLQRHARGELKEVFGTGTAAVISPVGELAYQGQDLIIQDGQMGPLSRHLLQSISDLQRGRVADPFGWMRKLTDLESVLENLSGPSRSR